ncbi:MAG: C13 family peptidase, partial [Sphingomicrobium sp.]
MTNKLLRGGIIVLLIAVCSSAGAQSAEEAASAQRRLDAALASFAPQRPGVVDAYVIAVSLNGDPVFGREAREAGKVLSRRFDAVGRTVVLAQDEGSSRADATGSPVNLAHALIRVAQVMDRNEDVLVLYSTSHGARGSGLVYQAAGGEAVNALVPPRNLSKLFKQLGIKNRLVIIQACYSGQFIPALKSDSSIVLTAASAD